MPWSSTSPRPLRSEGRRSVAAIAAAGLAMAGCFESTLTTSTSSASPISADTTLVGELALRNATTGSPSAPAGPVLVYRNTTTRTFDALGIALNDNAPASLGACVPPSYAFVDTVLTALPPGAERTVASGGLPASIGVFVTRAVSAGTSFPSALAGRWAGAVTEWRGGTAVARAAVAVSRSSGLMLVRASIPGDTLLVLVRLAQPRPLAYSAFPGRCETSYSADAQQARVRFTTDSLDVTAAAIPTAVTDGGATLPDSFRVLLGRRP